MKQKSGSIRNRIGIFALAAVIMTTLAGTAMADPFGPPSTFTAYTKNFQGDLFTGMASMSVPMETGGPGLSLNYSSGAVDERIPREKANWVGLGWSLSGLGSIRMDQDGKYYINGGGVSGELVCVTTGGCAAGGEYKTRMESFSKITHTTTPSDYWTVKSRNATESRFGYNADSEWAYDKPEWNASGNFREWLLDQVQDVDGNATLVSYATYTDRYCIGYYNYSCSAEPRDWKTYTREVLPNEIKWNYRGSPLTKVGHDRKVTFSWGSRTDYDNVAPGYDWSPSQGLYRYHLPEYSSRYKLDSVSVWIDLNDSGGTTPDAGELIRRYDLSYDYSAGGLTLLSAAIKGTNGTSSLPATTFTYTNSRLTSVNNGIGGTSSIVYTETTNTTSTQTGLSASAHGSEGCSVFGCTQNGVGYVGNGPYTSSAAGTVDIFNNNYQTAEFAVSAAACAFWGYYAPVGTRNVGISLTDGTNFVEIFAINNFEGNQSGTIKLVRKNDGKIDVYWAGAIYKNISYPYTTAKLYLTAYSSGGINLDCRYGNVSGYATISTGPVTASFKGRNTVASTSANDGLGNTTTSTYQYEIPSYPGGTYSEFRGFGKVTATNPDGSKGVTYFHQGDIYRGMVEKSFIEDSAGKIYGATKNEYDYVEMNNGSPKPVKTTDESSATGGVYFPRLRATNSYTVEGDAAFSESTLSGGTYKMARSEVAYVLDANGNTTQSTSSNYGEYATALAQTVTTYINDTTTNILGLPCETIVSGYDINNAWGAQRHSKTYYDGQTTACTALPASPKGLPTRTDSYKYATNFVTTTMGYDAYGNPKWTKDARANAGGTTSLTCAGVSNVASCISYDSVYNVFPTTTCNAKNFCGTVSYDNLMRPTQVTDINGQITSTEYDVFGRVTKVAKPGDTLASPTVQTVYNYIASLPSSPAYVQTIAKDGTADGLRSYTLVDGLGRTVQTKAEGVNANDWYTVDTFYNSQGRLDKTYVVYTTSTAAPATLSRSGSNWMFPTYDSIGRVVKVTKPDNTSNQTIYGQWMTTVKDALGHKKVSYTDGLGMVIKVEEYTGTNSYALYSTITNKYNTGTGELVQTTHTPAAGQ